MTKKTEKKDFFISKFYEALEDWMIADAEALTPIEENSKRLEKNIVRIFNQYKSKIFEIIDKSGYHPRLAGELKDEIGKLNERFISRPS